MIKRGRTRPAADNAALAPNGNVAAVGALGVVHRARVEQAGIALHFQPLETAGDARLIVAGVGVADEVGTLGEVNFHIAVQAQRPRHKIARRDIQDILRPAGVNGALQGGGVFGFAVALGPVGGGGHVDAVLFPVGMHNAPADPMPTHLHLHGVVGVGHKVLYGAVSFLRICEFFIVDKNSIYSVGRSQRRLVPIQDRHVRRTARVKIRFGHMLVVPPFWFLLF